MKVGDRVAAIFKADEKCMHLFGYGTYQGDHVPEPGEVKSFGIDFGEVGISNPKIELEYGEVVWGCQCWWGPAEDIKNAIGDRMVVYVKPSEIFKKEN